MDLPKLISTLIAAPGPQIRPPSTDPFHLVLWEQVGYLADDEKRLVAYRRLQGEVGLEPAPIAAARLAKLRDVARTGGAIGVEERASRMKDSAKRVLDEHGGDLAAALRSSTTPAARKILKSFPMIGEPGADKILLFSGLSPVFALESNGLRVLLRFGIGKEDTQYAKSYRSVMKDLEGKLPSDIDGLVEAYLALRRHGQEICKRTTPACGACPLAKGCEHAREAR